MTDPDEPARAGDLLDDRYRLRVAIGSGGTAQVWAADDERLHRTVAVKLLHPHLVSHAGVRTRFTAEVLAIAGCNHPNIIAVHDVLDERAGYVMEFIDGITLREWLDDRGRLDADEVRRLGQQMSSALDAAHTAGVIHRDVTPSNILVTPSGVAKLGDFGIARADDEVGVTRTDGVLGTAPYLSPEQLEHTSVTAATDTYSLGIVLYEAATGTLPFRGSSDAAVALARLHESPTPVTAHRPDLPGDLAVSIMGCLRMIPAERTRFPTSTDDVSPPPDRQDVSAPTSRPEPAPRHPVTPPARTRPADIHTPIDTDPVVAPGTRPRRRSGLWLAVVLIIVGLSLLVVAGLLSDRGGDSGAPTTSPTTTVSPVRLVPISSISTYDPDGTGPSGENDDLLDRLRDNDEDSTWTSERYESRDFGSKRGIGLVLTAPTTVWSTRLEIDSPNPGWSGVVAIGDDPPTTPPTDGTPVTATSSPQVVELPDQPGRHLTLWITRLGDTGAPAVEISELRWYGEDQS